MSMPNPRPRAGGDGTDNHDNENNLAKFKNADVIGHPAGFQLFQPVRQRIRLHLPGAGTPFMPYLLSTLGTLAWRYNVPDGAKFGSVDPGGAKSAVARD